MAKPATVPRAEYVILALLAILVISLVVGTRLLRPPRAIVAAEVGREGQDGSSHSQFISAREGHSLAGWSRVIDGDTLVVAGEHIRLFGIDAPEKEQPCSVRGLTVQCGQDAKAELLRLIGNREVSCDPRTKDRYGRTVAVCWVGDKDIGGEMVANGWAVAFDRYSHDYDADEAAARAAGIGLWQGTFERPDQWRARHRAR